MSRSLPALVALLVLACASPREEASTPDVSVVRAQLDTLWATYAAAVIAGDADAVARLYTDSAYLVESGLPTIRGKAALLTTVKEVLGGVRFLESRITPDLTELTGDRVVQIGTYLDVIQPTGQPTQRVFGRFAAVLERDSTSVWRVSRLLAVADSTVPAASTPK